MTLKFGRNRPTVRYPILSFKNYVIDTSILPTIPSTIDYTTGAETAIAQMYNNDTLGDCVIACVEHLEGVLTGDASDNNTTSNSQPLLFTSNQTIAFYSAACGYQPGKPQTDQGCDIQQVLHYWQNNGSPNGSSHKIAGILAVDPANTVEQQLSVYLFENLIFGCDLPDAWVNPEPTSNGFIWDVAGNINQSQGHCFLGVGYNANGILISTWGMTGTITYAATSEYMANSNYGELYVVISEDQLNSATNLAPNGLNWTQLVSDFNALGGNVVISNTSPNTAPNTAPNTTPVPVPNTSPNTTPVPVPNTSPNTAPNTAPNTTPVPVPGSAQWYHDNLSPTNYQELITVYDAVQHYNPEKFLVSSAGWLLQNLKTINAYNDFIVSLSSVSNT